MGLASVNPEDVVDVLGVAFLTTRHSGGKAPRLVRVLRARQSLPSPIESSCVGYIFRLLPIEVLRQLVSA